MAQYDELRTSPAQQQQHSSSSSTAAAAQQPPAAAPMNARDTPPAKPAVPPQAVPGLHVGSKSDFGDDIDIDDMIERMGCSQDYYKLEDCLGEFDRDWTKCQAQVKQLRMCNDRLQKLKAASSAAPK